MPIITYYISEMYDGEESLNPHIYVISMRMIELVEPSPSNDIRYKIPIP